MSHQASNETVLRPLAREGGRLNLSRLTCRGILPAGWLAWAGLVRTGQRAEGWDLVLARQEPGHDRGSALARHRDPDLRRRPRRQGRQPAACLAGCRRRGTAVLPHRSPDGSRQPVHRPRLPRGTITLHGTPAYAGSAADEAVRRAVWAEHTVAQTRLEMIRAERSDARRSALDEALAPLLELAAPLRTGAERDALAAYVLRKLHNAWNPR